MRKITIDQVVRQAWNAFSIRAKDTVKETWKRFRTGLSDTPEIFLTGGLTGAWTMWYIYNNNALPPPEIIAAYAAVSNLIADPLAEAIIPAFLVGYKEASEKYLDKYSTRDPITRQRSIRPGRVLIEFVLEPLTIGAATYFMSRADDTSFKYDPNAMAPSEMMGYLGFKAALPVIAGYGTEVFEALSYPVLRVGRFVLNNGLVPLSKYLTREKYE